MKRKPNIIEAIKNPKLFGSLPRFKKFDSWSSWLVVLKAIFGLPMTADDLAIFIRHTGRVTPPEAGSKETYLVIGRRGGKSFISALITCFIACFLDFKPFITVGETLVVMCLARDKEQARIVFRYVKAILNHVPALRNMIADQRADEIELTTGITIMVKASDFGGVRGPTIACVVADEIAFWPSFYRFEHIVAYSSGKVVAKSIKPIRPKLSQPQPLSECTAEDSNAGTAD
jgi:Terminase large subunit, ATPase domain